MSTAEAVLRESCGQSAWPDQPPHSNFVTDLHRLADLLEAMNGYPKVGDVTHAPKLWATSLRAKADVIAVLLEQPSWTTTPPTEPGWYWHRDTESEFPVDRMVRVYGKKCPFSRRENEYHLKNLPPGEWHGPLEPPQ